MQRIFIGALCALTLLACEENDRKVGQIVEKENGLKYEFLRAGEGEASTDTTRFLVADVAVLTSGDSVLFKSDTAMPAGFPAYNDQMQGLLAEGLKMLRKDDSVRFYIPAENFFLQTNKMPVPFGIDAKQDLKITIGVRDVTDSAGYVAMQQERFARMQERQLAQQQEVLKKDTESIKQYLSENNIEAQATESGLHYVVKERGQGPTPQPGDQVKVKYSGRLMDGTEFDSGEIELAVGQGRVIRGWDEGLLLLPEGTDASFYIPSPLGYGVRGSGGVIPPNSILVFDVEILDVTEAGQN